MFCVKCGTELAEDMKFCTKCGTKIFQKIKQETEQESKQEDGGQMSDNIDASLKLKKQLKKRKTLLKKLILIGTATAAIIIAIVLVFGLSRNSKTPATSYPETMAAINIFSGDDSILVLSSKGDQWHYDGERAYQAPNLDGAATLISIESEDDSDDNTGNALYLIKDEKEEFIADSVYSYVISAQGNAVAYTAKSPGEDSFSLYLYSNGETKTISSDSSEKILAISPDGTALAYADNRNEAWIWSGSYISIGDNLYPFALSEKGEIVYLIAKQGSKNAMCYFDGTEVTRLLADINNYGMVYLNSSGTEIIYTDKKDNSYIRRQGEDAKKLGVKYEILVPHNTQSMSWFKSIGYGSDYVQFPFVYTKGVESFVDMFAMSSKSGKYSIVKLDDEFNSTTIIRSCREAYLCSDGYTIIYSNSNGISKLNADSENNEPQSLLISKLDKLMPSADGVNIYYAQEKEAKGEKDEYYARLFYVKDGQGVMIADKVTSYSNYLDNGSMYYTIGEGLYISKSGCDGTLIKRLDISLDIYIFVNKFGITVNGENEDGDKLVYYSTDGENFSLVSTIFADPKGEYIEPEAESPGSI